MIKINPQIKDKKIVYQNHINFPHLFALDEDEYYLSRNFWCDFDKDYNLIIETILDGEQLKAEILKVLNRKKEFAKTIIEQEQKELASINEMLVSMEEIKKPINYDTLIYNFDDEGYSYKYLISTDELDNAIEYIVSEKTPKELAFMFSEMEDYKSRLEYFYDELLEYFEKDAKQQWLEDEKYGTYDEEGWTYGSRD